MELGSIINRFGNAMKTIRYSQRDTAEITGLCKKIESYGYRNITVSPVDSKNARITAKGSENSDITFDLNFADRTEVQTEKRKSHAFSLIDPVREWVQTVKGSLEKARTVRTAVRGYKDNGDFVRETVDYQNLISGNHFRMVRNANEKPKFYKNVDGDFVEMFSKS